MVGPQKKLDGGADSDYANYEKKRAKHFSGLALRNLGLMKLHKEFGLLPKKEGWGNISEHCVVEAAAAEVVADSLGLSEDLKRKLVQAALLHDYYKRREVEKARAAKNSATSFDEAADESKRILLERGIDKDVVTIADSAGHTSLSAMQDLLQRSDELNDVEKLQMVFHYLDDITLNTDIVPLDLRIDMLENNPKYVKLNESGREIFNGRKMFDVQREVGQRIESWLAKNSGVEDAKKTPLVIKEEIEERIEGIRSRGPGSADY